MGRGRGAWPARCAPALLLIAASALSSLHGPVRAAAARESTLTVFAGASLTEAFQELGRAFEERHPGVGVRLNFAGSQHVAMQLAQGARADLFASADWRWMDYVRGRGLTRGAPRLFARNLLVAIVPADNPARIERLGDLARSGVALVMCAEAVPVGKYGREMLRNLSRSPEFPRDFAGRVLANLVSEEENVKSVVGKILLGEADAGIVFGSDVTPAVARRVRVIAIPRASNVLASYPIVLLRHAAHPDLAHAFLALLQSRSGQEILRRHGLLPAGGEAR
jgi:molybdate transport system substrate-binding protein